MKISILRTCIGLTTKIVLLLYYHMSYIIFITNIMHVRKELNGKKTNFYEKYGLNN